MAPHGLLVTVLFPDVQKMHAMSQGLYACKQAIDSRSISHGLRVSRRRRYYQYVLSHNAISAFRLLPCAPPDLYDEHNSKKVVNSSVADECGGDFGALMSA